MSKHIDEAKEWTRRYVKGITRLLVSETGKTESEIKREMRERAEEIRSFGFLPDFADFLAVRMATRNIALKYGHDEFTPPEPDIEHTPPSRSLEIYYTKDKGDEGGEAIMVVEMQRNPIGVISVHSKPSKWYKHIKDKVNGAFGKYSEESPPPGSREMMEQIKDCDDCKRVREILWEHLQRYEDFPDIAGDYKAADKRIEELVRDFFGFVLKYRKCSSEFIAHNREEYRKGGKNFKLCPIDNIFDFFRPSQN